MTPPYLVVDFTLFAWLPLTTLSREAQRSRNRRHHFAPVRDLGAPLLPYLQSIAAENIVAELRPFRGAVRPNNGHRWAVGKQQANLNAKVIVIGQEWGGVTAPCGPLTF